MSDDLSECVRMKANAWTSLALGDFNENVEFIMNSCRNLSMAMSSLHMICIQQILCTPPCERLFTLFTAMSLNPCFMLPTEDFQTKVLYQGQTV